MPWPPVEGELLPCADEAVEIHRRLRDYALNPDQEDNRGKARGFLVRLGIDVASINYLEAEIRLGISQNPISSVRPRPPHGINCVVQFEIRGIERYIDRKAPLRTVWRLRFAGDNPRLLTALLK